MESYEPLGVLAAALYGDVYKLRHRATGDLVALKRMDLVAAARRRTKDTNRPIEEDVFAEVQTNLTLRRLGGHRHVVALHDCFADDTSVSLVTAFCARGELLEVVNARGSLLPVEDALRYFHQIVQGVAFLHANGIAHRDLSLENVLVDEFDCCKLSDFGMASTATRLRATGIGKIQYMAPEACRELEQSESFYNPFETDIWSLGVILITLLTGQYPFDRALDSDAHFQLLSTGSIEFLLDQLDFDAEGYDDVVDILKAMLAVEPTSRATAGELLAHECFDEFTAVDLTVSMDMGGEEGVAEIVEEDVNPAEDETEDSDDDEVPDLANHDVDIATPTSPCKLFVTARPYAIATLFSGRRPTPIDTTTTRSSCTYVRPSGSSRKSPAALKEQRASNVLALTPTLATAARMQQRRTPKGRKKCALRGVLDGVFRRKRARGPTPAAKP